MSKTVLIPVKELAAECHAISREKGWWDDAPEYKHDQVFCDSIEALILSEISEALEELRTKPPDTLHSIGKKWNHDFSSHNTAGKPVGWVVELADAAIRIFDFMGWQDNAWEQAGLLHELPVTPFGFSHRYAAHKLMRAVHCVVSERLRYALLILFDLALWTGCEDFLAVIRVKMEYNKTRPHRHGGKYL